jgi:hypothetical protein
MNTTTRRYPRTMLEAWPTHYPYAVERTVKPVSFRGAVLLCVVGIALGLVSSLLWQVL